MDSLIFNEHITEEIHSVTLCEGTEAVLRGEILKYFLVQKRNCKKLRRRLNDK